VSDIADRLTELIQNEGPIPLARFMGEANAHYYATRDPIGAKGDFVTAPEISQMFGELVGLCLADLWDRADSPRHAHYVELGPGRGTLANDALRAMRGARCRPDVHFVETSPVLRAMQADMVEEAVWHDDITTLPESGPLLIVANEFFDALPVRQLISTTSGWRERMIGLGFDGFAPVPGSEPMDAEVPSGLRHVDPGGIIESAPAAAALVRALAERIARQGGALIVIDYGHTGRAHGDTLQAVHAHAYADPFARPGSSDLTAHVDFGALARAVARMKVDVWGPVEQGAWLTALGIASRESALARAHPQRERELAEARRRLTDPEEMGSLFKALAIVSDRWPKPAGF
jgi:NADH dehydrogenase [ubiquinone] 1 alpha subcomplex assembly factor 7